MKNRFNTPTLLANPTSVLRSARPLLGLALLTLSLAACGTRTTGSTPADTAAPVATSPATLAADRALVPYVYDGKDHSWSSSQTLKPQALLSGNNNLSAQNYSSATNGWGPVEINESNGERGSSDGHTLTVNGKTYSSGLGVHSDSVITYDLNGQCTGFQTDMGMDDEVRSLGTVTFEIWADGSKLYDSGLVTGGTPTKFKSVDLTGKRQLKLVVTDADDGINYDHADWGGATLLGCNTTSSSAVSYSGPLVITKGGTYSGNWESQDPRVAAVTVQTSEPVIIENSNIRGRGTLITGFGNRLTVRNVNGYGLNPNIWGWTVGKFVNAEEFVNIRIENSYAENTQGVYFRSYKGSASSGDTVKILRTKFKNINGLPSNGNEGYDLNQPDKTAHMIQFNDVRRIPNVEIAWNEVINEPSKSQVEENINMYLSSGTPTSPMLIHDNYIQGAYNAQPATRTGYAGGGIIIGDGVVSNILDNGYASVYNNQIVSTTNEGLALAGGVGSRFWNNRVISSGLLPDGRRILAQNVGMYMWDANRTFNNLIPGFDGNSMNSNYIAWTKVASDGSTSTNPWWMPSCGILSNVCTGNVNGGTATLDTERQEYQLWLNKLSSNGIRIGKQN